MGDAHAGNHDVAFFEAAIEETLGATATTGSLTNVNVDSDGALRPGRYLIQGVGIGTTQTVWVHVGKYERTVALVPAGSAVAPGPKRFPLTAAVAGIETHCLGNYSDRVAVQLSAGGNVQIYMTLVSSIVRKSNQRA